MHKILRQRCCAAVLRLLVLLATLGLEMASAQTVYPTGTTIWEHDKTLDGLTLFTAPTGEALAIGMDGRVVNRWRSPERGQLLLMVTPLANGHILALSGDGKSAATQLAVELDWDGDVVWRYRMAPEDGHMHHDIQRLANGNTLVLCARKVLDQRISPAPLIDDCLLEIAPDGRIVWSWFTHRHFHELGFSARARDLIAAHAGDWAHANSARPLPRSAHGDAALRAGNILVSQRSTNLVFIVDRATGAVVWKTDPTTNLTHGQHAPYMIEQGLPGAGNVLVFDNGSGTGYPLGIVARAYSRILELDPVTMAIRWQYDASASGRFRHLFFSDIVSNAQRLANGNTLICSGVKGRMFEVTESGEIVWEYMSPYVADIRQEGHEGPLVYRAFRLPRTWEPRKPHS